MSWLEKCTLKITLIKSAPSNTTPKEYFQFKTGVWAFLGKVSVLCFPSKRQQINFCSLPILWNWARLQSCCGMLYWIPVLHLLLPSRFQAQAGGEVSPPLLTVSFWETDFPASRDGFASTRWGYFRQRWLFTGLPTAEQRYFHSKLHPKDPEFRQVTDTG